MVAQHAFRTGNRWQNALRPAAETSEEMRLNEPRQYFEIRFDKQSIDANVVPESRFADMHEIGIIVGIMLNASVIADDLVTQHAAQFRFGLRTMRAEGIKQR